MGMIVRQAPASFLPLLPHLRILATAFIAAVFLAAGAVAPAQANSKYAAYVIDAKTGEVLFERNANARRYPASLTKMMTAYLIFEAMAAGRISADTRVPFSKNAAAEPPTKLGVGAGNSITIDTALRALVTRSANDVATAVGELLGGSEANFARMMTTKARQLGMTRTQFRNAHGLPNSDQYTTARDMAILGIALREHFPQYYDYFSTRSFTYRNQRIRTHNHMFKRIEGVDGIKTGYIRASGFNLVTSVEKNGRSVVGVVMGGRTSRSRDDHMTELLSKYLPEASRGRDSMLVASHQPTPAFALPSRDIPLPVYRPAATKTIVATAPVAAAAVTAYAPETTSAAMPIPSAPIPSAPVPTSVASISADRFGDAGGAVDPMMTSSTPKSGWVVQVASSPSQDDAFAALVRTGKEASGILGSANAFIEEFDNKGTIFYRARFGGFDSKDHAWNACNALKKQNIDCYAVQL